MGHRATLVAAGAAVLLAAGSSDLLAQPAPPPVRVEAVDAPTFRTRFTPAQMALLEKLNRRDLEHLLRLKDMIIPEEWRDDELTYSPLPLAWAWAAGLPKAIVVHQPSQVFGAYEAGRLVRWGPVSSGRKETPTPAGVYALTWKAKSRVSTDNDQWLLKWYFNFINSRGVSFHQFELPGVPASHACVRLLERDAEWLYAWGEQWTLTADRRSVAAPGTPVLILEVYDYSRPAPWISAEWWRTPIVLPADPAR